MTDKNTKMLALLKSRKCHHLLKYCEPYTYAMIKVLNQLY